MESHQDRAERSDETRREASENDQAALLIDFDNVTMGIRSNLGQELRNLLNSDVIRGKVAVQRAYADWRRYPQYIVPLSEASIDLIFAPAYGSSKKNATDIRLAIDALELVFVRPEIKTFILMSGDSDFSSLVLKLKEYGKYVIGVGIQESSSDLLVQNCDEYYSYSALSGLSKAGEQPSEVHDPWVLVEKAIQRMLERGDTMRSDRLKQVMLEIDPSFNERELGFSKFNRFVVEAGSKGLISIQKMENGQYGVAPAKGAVKGVERKGKKEKTERKETRARGEAESPGKERAREKRPARESRTRRARPKLTMKSALELLNRALDSLLVEGVDSVRDSDVKRKLLELDAHFDEGEIGYSKFSKFLQAAEGEGAVTLSRGANGNYQVGRAKSVPRPKPRAKEEQKERPGESPVQRLARLLFGARKTEAPAGAAEPTAESAAERARPVKTEARAPHPRTAGARADAGKGGARDTVRGSGSPRGKKAPRTGARTPRGQTKGEAAATRGGKVGRTERTATRERRKGERPRRSGKPEDKQAPAKAGGKGGVRGVRGVEAPSEPVVERESLAPPVEAAPAARPSEAEAAAVERTAPAEPAGRKEPFIVPAPLPGAPRGTIRGRWGTRGRYRPAEAPPPILEGQRAAREARAHAAADRARSGSEGEGKAELVARVKRYPGVGERTAEALVEAFGANLFRVLDEEPERIRAMVPDHRAERVLEARRREREAGDA